MRKVPILGAVVAAMAIAPAAASAAPATTVFKDATTPLTCTVQSGATTTGQRWCGTTSGTTPGGTSTVASFDGTPIDVSVALPPAPSSGTDGHFPVIGLYHGYGSAKIGPSTSTAQHWLAQGYAVFSITDRGFWGSCGVLVQPNKDPKPAPCAKGYIHLMSNEYEVRDAQYLLGMLADDGAIDPQRIGATGGSYGGGMSEQLGALKNRTQLTDGSLVPWTSPKDHLPMQIAATAPEFAWSDLVQSLMPNGSGLDYAAKNPYVGPAGDRRFGIEKLVWNLNLYGGGAQTGYYASPYADNSANISIWANTNLSGGPYDVDPVVAQELEQFPLHGSYGTDDSVAPAPALLSNGWNDDLFPVDEALRYYNKIRADHPDTPISLFDLNFGHANRASTPTPDDAQALSDAEDAWFSHYVKGDGPTPTDAVGGVTVLTSACAPTTSATYHAKNWASLAPGEIRVDGAAAQTIAPNTSPATTYSPADPRTTNTVNNPTVCTTGPDADTSGAAVYETDPAPAAGYTIAGAPTILADLTVKNANDAVIGRLYDVDNAAGTERLIARGTYRPTSPGSTSRQVWQLHPQAWKVQAGHTVKLELLGQDSPYALPATGQAAVGVANLQLRLPTIDAPGALDGLVQTPAEKVLPRGYELAADLPKPAPVDAGTTPTTPVAPVAPVTPTTPVVVPTAKTDPLAPGAALSVLKRAPKLRSITRSLRTLKFTDTLPEAGRVTYGLSIRVGGRDRPVGTSVRRVTKAGAIVVTIRPNADARKLLKAHPKTALTVRSYFVTAIEGRHLNVVRTLKR